MIAPASQTTAPDRPVWWRATLAVAVLVGLFLMHGITANASSTCPNGIGQLRAITAGQVVGPSGAAVGARPAVQSTASIDQCGCDDSMSASCVPLAQKRPGALLSILLLALAWTAALDHLGTRGGLLRAPRSWRTPRRRLAPLALTCVSRT